jgi:hypothetical protein
LHTFFAVKEKYGTGIIEVNEINIIFAD